MDDIITKIQFRQDTSANWEAADPTLATGEPAYDITNKAFKIGDGNSTWKNLPFLNSDSIIEEPLADGKLYGRVRNVGADAGHWEEIIIPVVDTRKNFNDILQSEYNIPIDMGFDIVVNSNTKRVYGVKKKVSNINLREMNATFDAIIAGMGHIYSIVDIRGTFDCGHGYTYQLNSINFECNTFTYLKDNALHLVATLTDVSKQIDNGVAELFIMYTSVSDDDVEEQPDTNVDENLEPNA